MRPLFAAILAAAFGFACGASTAPPTPSASPSATATSSIASTSSPSASPAAHVDHGVVYFARDRLPPVSAAASGAGAGATAEQRVLSRVTSLFASDASRPLFNIARTSRARVATVHIDGDLATVDFTVPAGDWGVAGSAAVRAFVQQVVYTITEEPGIRRALITENGASAVIGGEGLVIDHPATREDVSGYPRASTAPVTWRTDRAVPVAARSKVYVDEVASGLSRLVIDTGVWGAKAMIGFTASVVANDERAFPDQGKWTLALSIPAATADDGVRIIDRTPVRSLRATTSAAGARFEIGLDDLRPWRVAMLYEPLRLVLDIGGDPDAVSPNIALYRPAFGATAAMGDEMSGLIRAFEGRFEYRIRDASGEETIGHATASLGTADLWGTFSLPLPELPTGAATLEVVLRSPKDGSVSESVFTSFDVAP